MTDLGELIRRHPFFADMPESVSATIAGCARNAVYADGDYLFKEGGAADTFFLLREGRVALEVFVAGRSALTVETLEGGDILGWSWLVPPYRWTFDARALGRVRALVFDGACLRGNLDDDPQLAVAVWERFIGVMADRLSAARMRLLDMYGNPNPARAHEPE